MADTEPGSLPAVAPIGPPLLTRDFDNAEVTELRHAVAACAAGWGLGGQPLDDFVVAVNELLTNVVRHGGGSGWITVWAAGETLSCEVSDAGPGITPGRLARHDRPALDTAGGWGLWLARELSETMTVRTGPEGTSVRVTTRRG